MKSVCLIYPKHKFGILAEKNHQNLPPPIGILLLGARIETECDNFYVEIFDENQVGETDLSESINSDIVGISVVFSNYSAGINLAKSIKKRRPNCTILIGGPNVNGIERKILANNPCIDFIFSGESELSLVSFLNGKSLDLIPGLTYRSKSGFNQHPTKELTNLDEIPLITFDSLKTPYQWQDNVANNSAFPISGIRGCMKTNRCDYCSIPSKLVRKLSPNRYWQQLHHLHYSYGITRFFETGDMFDPAYAKALAIAKPETDFSPRLRIYSYPGMINGKNIQYFKAIGVDNVFIGVESILLWESNNSKIRKRGTSVKTVIDEIKLLSKHGISTMPSFILGLPGENLSTLYQNIDLINEIASLNGVNELLINSPFPLPNSNYFSYCLNSQSIVDKYYELTGYNLQTYDQIDYPLLSRLFIERFTDISYSTLCDTIENLKEVHSDKIANWGLSKNKSNKPIIVCLQ